MANNYTEFSEMIPCETKEQQAWLLQKLAVAIEFDDGEKVPTCAFETDGKDVWVYTEDSVDLDALADVVAAFQVRFNIDKPWTLTWADTCSKPRISNFGGGGIVVYKGKTHWMNTWGWCTAEVHRLTEQGKDVDTTALDNIL